MLHNYRAVTLPNHPRARLTECCAIEKLRDIYCIIHEPAITRPQVLSHYMNFFVFPCSTHGYAKQTTTPGLLNSIHFLQNQNPVTAIPLCRRNKNCLPAVLIFCEKFCETDPLTHSSPNANFVPHTSCRFLVYLNFNGIPTIRRS